MPMQECDQNRSYFFAGDDVFSLLSFFGSINLPYSAFHFLSHLSSSSCLNQNSTKLLISASSACHSAVYDHLIKALESNHPVELEKLYFVLPAKKLNFPLTAADMAALAVKASAAFTATAYVEVLPFMGVVDVQTCKRFNEVRVGGWKSGWAAFSNGETKQSSSRTRLSAIEEIE